MAESQKTMAAVLAALPDNNTGDASTQDIRNAIESLRVGYALMDVDRGDAGYPAETTISAVDTATKAAGVTDSEYTPYRFTVGTDNKITYTGDVPSIVVVTSSVSVTCADNRKLVGVGFLKNGATASSDIVRLVAAGIDQGASSNNWIFRMEKNDYIELYVINRTDATNITVNDAHTHVVAYTE